MIYKLFAVKDKALDTYSAPFTQATMESGLRMWRDLIMYGQENNQYRRSPEDYTLCLVGEYDDDSGKAVAFEKPTQVSSAVEVLAQNKQEG